MTLAPTSIAALQDALATSRPGPVRLAGAGTKARASAGPPRLDLRGLRGIGAYDPAECVLTALAGTPVADIEAALAAHQQYLPFDPTHVRAGGTIGGTVASGLSGSGRYRYGGVRDFIIGARIVDGHGRLIASGGQVVKNAAGFLTHHALVGSAGRLGAIADVTFKVFPRPEARGTLRAPCRSLADALAAHERLRATAMDLEALDLVTTAAGGFAVWVRLAGAADALPARVARARGLLACTAEVLTGDDDAGVWGDAAELAWAADAAAVVKVPTTPSRVLTVVGALTGLGTCRVQCGGVVTLLATDHPADAVDRVLARHGWRGVVVQGAAHGCLLGAAAPSAFGDRVRRALDPDQRFH
ncbi:MAG TPA: FAD-binding protein [Vicinamibacterales bacterium]|nr:FAD-binding protein [Vicinamibacterales bacterium]